MSTSHRQILRSSAIIGSASVLNILLGIARLKGAALIVGPVGLGLIGLYLNVVTAAATLIGLGMNASGVREIAAAKSAGDVRVLDSSRRALVWTSVLMSALVAGLLFLLREPIAVHLLGDARLASAVIWLGIAGAFLALSTVCAILLNGFRRTGALAWHQVGSALAGTIAGIAILLLWRERGLIAYVIAVQAAALVVGLALALRLPRTTTPWQARAMFQQSRTMVALGLSFMVSVFVSNMSMLSVRWVIGDQLGGVALGHFAASWIICSTYIGFVLQAMGTDFYPRLSETIDDRPTAARLISEQVETAVLLAAPLLILTLAAAPWVLQLAYSEAFRPAAALLRWQILGDLFKIASWPFAMSLLAAKRGKTYVLIEASTVLLFTAFVWLTVEELGIAAAGIGYFIMYVGYSVVVMGAAGMRLDRQTAKVCLASGLLVGITFLSTLVSETLSLTTGIVAFVISIALLLSRLDQVGALPFGLRPLLAKMRGR